MSYLVLARKFRPRTFDEVVGQSHVTRTLANAIEMDRVAHGFLFSGVRGVGKTSLARILAKSLNCQNGPTKNPCGTCESCKSITDGTSVDVIEIDGASNNSVDDIRDLRETIPYKPLIGRYKIYVIDEVHMLSVSAFNALLKTLEEPPPHVKFIFATTEPHKIPATILSRIQRYDFRRIPTIAITDRIEFILEKEEIKAEKTAVAIIGREAEGSMRDALSILDQILASGEKHITARLVEELLGVVGRKTYFDLCDAIIAKDPLQTLHIIRDVDKQGFDIPVFAKGLIEHVRNLMVASLVSNDLGFLDLPNEEIDKLAAQAKSTSRETIHRLFKHLGDAYDEIFRSAFPKILLEATVARLADMGEVIPAAELIKRIETLQAAIEKGSYSPGGGGAGNKNNPIAATATPQQQHKMQSGGSSVKKKVTSQAESHATQQIEVQPDTPSLKTDLKVSNTKLTPEGWEKLLSMLGRQMPAWSSWLERAVLHDNSTYSNITLDFDKDDTFTVDRVSNKATLSDIEQQLAQILNYQVKLNVKLGTVKNLTTIANKKLDNEEQQRKRDDAVRNHPVVKGLEVALGGKISQISFDN